MHPGWENRLTAQKQADLGGGVHKRCPESYSDLLRKAVGYYPVAFMAGEIQDAVVKAVDMDEIVFA